MGNIEKSLIHDQRVHFHHTLLQSLLTLDFNNIPSNADKDSRVSIELSRGIYKRLGSLKVASRLAGQSSGNKFEEICTDFLSNTFLNMARLRPADWYVKRCCNRNRLEIAKYDQYQHLIDLDRIARESPKIASIIGNDYMISPDIIIYRNPMPDSEINLTNNIVDLDTARLTRLRRVNSDVPILHATISCKWTIRSDRAQNARSEALNLIRNRKGKLPHIVVVTGEPTPGRIASLALGTGDIDCVYHFALYELCETLQELQIEDSFDLLNTMIEGKRVRDISDLPFDLMI